MPQRYETTEAARRVPQLPPVHGTSGRGKVPVCQMDASLSAGLEDLDLGLAIRTYLESEGVDIERSLADAGYAREHAGQRAREQADRAEALAGALRRARRKLSFEQAGFCDGSPGFGVALIAEAQTRVDQLADALSECCCNDPELVSAAVRRAGR
jgi:hypothetical protein